MTYTMPVLLKNQWIDALLSGQYRQGRGFIYNAENKTFCPVGILYDIVAHEYPSLTRWNPSAADWKHPVTEKFISQVIVEEGFINTIDLLYTVADLTDTLSFSHKKTARWIDDNVEGI